MNIAEQDVAYQVRRMLRNMIRVPVIAPREYTIGSPRVNSLGEIVYPIEYPESSELSNGPFKLHRSEFHPAGENGWYMMRNFYSVDDYRYQVALAEGPPEALGLRQGYKGVKGFRRKDWEDCEIPRENKLREGEEHALPRKAMGWAPPKWAHDLQARFNECMKNKEFTHVPNYES